MLLLVLLWIEGLSFESCWKDWLDTIGGSKIQRRLIIEHLIFHDKTLIELEIVFSFIWRLAWRLHALDDLRGLKIGFRTTVDTTISIYFVRRGFCLKHLIVLLLCTAPSTGVPLWNFTLNIDQNSWWWSVLPSVSRLNFFTLFVNHLSKLGPQPKRCYRFLWSCSRCTIFSDISFNSFLGAVSARWLSRLGRAAELP